MDDSPVSPVHRVVRAVVLVAVVGAVVVLVGAVVLRQERWHAEPIVGVLVSDGLDGRTMQVHLDSGYQNARVRVVKEDDETITLRAEVQGTSDDDGVTDGVVVACTAQPIGDRRVIDEVSGWEIEPQVRERPDLPVCE